MASGIDMPDFGKMVGPLPLGAWIGIVGGGLAFMAYSRSQSDSEPLTEPVEEWEDTSIPAGVGVGGTIGGSTDGGNTGGWTYTPPVSGGGSVAQEPDTNEAWGRRAVNGLIALGYDPAVSDSAIRKYMEGAALSASEYALVTIALGKYGAPPILLPAPFFAPPTLPKPPVAGAPGAGKPAVVTKPKPVSKPKVRYYTVRPGDTLSKIGKKYNVGWQSIYNANRTGKKRADGSKGILSNPNLIRPGQKLVIPN